MRCVQKIISISLGCSIFRLCGQLTLILIILDDTPDASCLFNLCNSKSRDIKMGTWQVRFCVCDLLVLFVPHVADESLRTCCDQIEQTVSHFSTPKEITAPQYDYIITPYQRK